jgi:hypothetical protein
MSGLLDRNDDIVRGAFYIIDHSGNCSPDVSKSSFQRSAIEAHLHRHTYYHPAPKGKVRVDVEKMQSVIQDLYIHVQRSDAVTKLAYGCRSDEDHVDSLFRIGTDKLPPQMLASYGYDKLTFREEDLSKYAQPPKPKNSAPCSRNKHIQRSFWIIIQDIEATKAAREHASYKYRDDASRLATLEALIRDFSLRHFSKREGMRMPCDSEQLCKTFMRTWGLQRTVGAAATPWRTGSEG